MSDIAGDNWNQLRDRLPRTATVFEQGLRDGLHPGAQVFVSRNGETVADATLGIARPGVPMRRDSIVLWLSMGKPLTAVLIARLIAAGKVTVATHISDVIPEFAVGGKASITIGHVLTHTGGFRNVSSNWSSAPWPTVIERISEAELETDWIVGESAGYHVASGWYILAEVARRLLDVPATDEAMSAIYQREIFEPLKMTDCSVGMSRQTYLDYGTRLALTFDTSKDEDKPMKFPSSELGHVLSRPGGNARGPVNQLGRFYEQLLIDRGELAGEQFLPREVATMFTTRRRIGLRDKTFGAQIDWTYGFLAANLEGNRVPYGYGPHATPTTFGHSGNQSSCAFADPKHTLVVCWATTGLPGELTHRRRQMAANTAIYEDLKLI